MELVKIKSNWWSFSLSGLIAIIYALMAFLVPGETAQIIVKASGIVVGLIGIICLLFALRRKKKMMPWGMLLFESIVMIVLGIVAFFWSAATINLIIFAIGLWSAIIGLFMLIVIFSIKDLINRGFYIISAIMSLLFGVLLMINPFESAKVFVIISGIIAMFFGVIMMMFGFAVRKHNATLIAKVVEEDVEEPAEQKQE